jgi:GGDEF domain-containing protein
VQACGTVDGAPVGVTASIGVVEIDSTHATLATVLDAAGHAAKRARRNAARAASSEPLLVSAGH